MKKSLRRATSIIRNTRNIKSTRSTKNTRRSTKSITIRQKAESERGPERGNRARTEKEGIITIEEVTPPLLSPRLPENNSLLMNAEGKERASRHHIRRSLDIIRAMLAVMQVRVFHQIEQIEVMRREAASPPISLVTLPVNMEEEEVITRSMKRPNIEMAITMGLHREVEETQGLMLLQLSQVNKPKKRVDSLKFVSLIKPNFL
jgi:hypothetical protein